MAAARSIARIGSLSILISIFACSTGPVPAPQATEGARLCVVHAQCGPTERCVGGVCEVPRPEMDGGAPAHPLDAVAAAPDARAIDPKDASTGLDARGGTADAPAQAATLDLAGYELANVEGGASGQTAPIPAGSVLEAGQSLIIARDATRAEFEQAWGRSIGSALFVSTGAQTRGVPIINGDERWSIADSEGRELDGPTIAGVAGRCFSRTAADQWEETAEEDGTPGEHSAPPGTGLVISEWCDRSGTGQFHFEFVELTWSP